MPRAAMARMAMPTHWPLTDLAIEFVTCLLRPTTSSVTGRLIRPWPCLSPLSVRRSCQIAHSQNRHLQTPFMQPFRPREGTPPIPEESFGPAWREESPFPRRGRGWVRSLLHFCHNVETMTHADRGCDFGFLAKAEPLLSA